MTPPTSPALLDQLASKRRSSRACVSCRSRKVKCDYVHKGKPCTNCRVDRFDCELAPKQKRRRRAVPSQGKGTESTSAEENNQVAGVESAQSFSPEDALGLQKGNIGADTATSPTELSQHRILHQVPHYAFLIGLTQGAVSPESGAAVGRTKDDVGSNLSHLQDAGNLLRGTRCGQDELFFLQRTGCFDLPAQATMNGFIDAYFTFFHPFFPVVSKPAFLREFREMDIYNCKGPSLLLLRAILFIASGLVSTNLLRDAGFGSRKDARQSLYKQTRYLYDLDYESDSITMIQSLLLMSHYYPSMTEKKHTWHWIHQAISVAQVAGLHRHPGRTSDRSLCSRVWWGCLVRDRLNSLGTSRPMMINSLDCDIPMLTMDDLQEPEDDEMQYAIKLMFIEFVKLCQYMEGVLSLQHDVMHTQDASPDQIRVCDEALRLWLDNLPSVARRQEPALSDDGRVNTAALYRAVLHAAYNTTIIALHGPSTLAGAPENRHPDSQLKVNLAAKDSTQLFSQLVTYDLVRYCPTICVTCVLPPLIVHLLELRASPTTELKQANHNRFDLCMMFLRQLRDIYWHASFYYEFFELAASIDTPSAAPCISSEDPLIRFLIQKVSLRNERAEVSGPASSSYLRVLHNFSQPLLSQALPTAQIVSAPRNSTGSADFEMTSPFAISDERAVNAINNNTVSGEFVQFDQWLDAVRQSAIIPVD